MFHSELLNSFFRYSYEFIRQQWCIRQIWWLNKWFWFRIFIWSSQNWFFNPQVFKNDTIHFDAERQNVPYEAFCHIVCPSSSYSGSLIIMLYKHLIINWKCEHTIKSSDWHTNCFQFRSLLNIIGANIKLIM